MANTYGGGIPTRGMISCYDAKNPKSFLTGGGMVCKDLGSNQKDMTLPVAASNGSMMLTAGTAAYSPTGFPISNNMTFVVWAKRYQSINPYNMVFGAYLPYLGFRSDGTLHLSVRCGGVQKSLLTSTGSPFLDNEWLCMAVSWGFDGRDTTCKIYVDGVIITSAVYTGAVTGTNVALLIGAWNPATMTDNPFNGEVSCLYAYNTELTQQEITKFFENTRQRFGK